MNHFNPRIELTGITFERNTDGIYKHKGSPFVVQASRIDIHGDGWIQLSDESEIRYVEEDAQTISRLIDEKIREQELYEIAQKKDDILGGDTTGTE